MKEERSDKEIVMMVLKYTALAIVGLIFLFGTFYTIPAGSRGVLTTFGKPSMDAKGEGLHMKMPLIQGVTKMQVQTMKYEAELSAASRDLQDVQVSIAINYHLLPSEVPKLYQEIGKDYAEKLIQPLEQEINKEISAQYTAEELITKRGEVRNKMLSRIMEKLKARSIIVEELSIVNFKFSPAFTQAIEAKVTMEQNALAAKNKLEQVKFEKEQKITQAQGEAEALRLQKVSITPELVELRRIEMMQSAVNKWDGKMPQATSGMPFIDVTPR